MTKNVSDEYLRKHGLFNLKDRLEMQRQIFKAGIVAALHDALILIRDTGVPTPEWVTEGSIKIAADRLVHGFKTGKKGRASNEATVYRDDMVKFRRWQVVDRLRDRLGMTIPDAAEEAEKILQGTFAKAAASTIQECFEVVQQDLKDPGLAKKYYPAMTDSQWLTDTPTV